MNDALEFLLRHGYVVLFLWMLGEQLGIPAPTSPLMLAAGALAGQGRFNFALAIALPVFASLIGDSVWYYVGKRRGAKVLNLLCKISLEPDSCVRKTENAFARNGAQSLLISKFVPGLNTMAPPLAGIFGMSMPRFLICDGLGALLYVATFVLAGFVFSDQLELVVGYMSRLGLSMAFVLGGGLTAYLLWKYIQRVRFIRKLRIARISPLELKQMIDSGDSVTVVDLRGQLDFAAEPRTIPGAIRVAAEKLADGHEQIPRDREIVLFCT
jgi:membrane protein DedA with SNARE-associated domain